MPAEELHAKGKDATQTAVLRVINDERSKEQREAKRAAVPLVDGMDLRIGDCRTVLADIADNSVALVLTVRRNPGRWLPGYAPPLCAVIWTARCTLAIGPAMAKRTVSPRQQQTYLWRISQFRHRLEPLGDVEAPDEASAIAKAVEEYQIREPWRQRSLLAKRYT